MMKNMLFSLVVLVSWAALPSMATTTGGESPCPEKLVVDITEDARTHVIWTAQILAAGQKRQATFHTLFEVALTESLVKGAILAADHALTLVVKKVDEPHGQDHRFERSYRLDILQIYHQDTPSGRLTKYEVLMSGNAHDYYLTNVEVELNVRTGRYTVKPIDPRSILRSGGPEPRFSSMQSRPKSVARTFSDSLNLPVQYVVIPGHEGLLKGADLAVSRAVSEVMPNLARANNHSGRPRDMVADDVVFGFEQLNGARAKLVATLGDVDAYEVTLSMNWIAEYRYLVTVREGSFTKQFSVDTAQALGYAQGAAELAPVDYRSKFGAAATASIEQSEPVRLDRTLNLGTADDVQRRIDNTALALTTAPSTGD